MLRNKILVAAIKANQVLVDKGYYVAVMYNQVTRGEVSGVSRFSPNLFLLLHLLNVYHALRVKMEYRWRMELRSLFSGWHGRRYALSWCIVACGEKDGIASMQAVRIREGAYTSRRSSSFWCWIVLWGKGATAGVRSIYGCLWDAEPVGDTRSALIYNGTQGLLLAVMRPAVVWRW